MDAQEVTAAMGWMWMAALKDFAIRYWHWSEACDGYRWFRTEPVRCPICLEERVARRKKELFAEWDALGLGYIGPRL